MRLSEPRPRRRPAAAPAALAVVLAATLAGCGDDTPPADGPVTTTPLSTGPDPAGSSTAVASPVPGSTAATTSAGSTATAAAPRTQGTLPAPFVASATWGDSSYGRTLKIAPTANGRTTTGPGDGDAAWREVLALRPEADTPGMYAQFLCHWDFARLLDPDKPTWNIEPWRPEVDAVALMASSCNPGGPEV